MLLFKFGANDHFTDLFSKYIGKNLQEWQEMDERNNLLSEIYASLMGENDPH